MEKYTIQASKDGINWKHQARFEEGEDSRWDTPFNHEIALQEAYGFKYAREKDFKYVRLIIDLK